MKKLLIILTGLCLCAFSCDETAETGMAAEKEALENLRTEIETLIGTTACTEDSGCDVIAFGSKPCGGPWYYLAYSTAVDTEALLEMVATYNELEATYNEKWGVLSDCEVVTAPAGVICNINGVCTIMGAD